MIIVDTVLSIISNGLAVGKEWLGLQSKKLDINNTEKMQKAAEAQNEVKQADKVNEIIKNKDTDAARKILSE